MRECAYNFNESIDGFFVASCVALAGVVITTHSPANSTKHRLRAIRLSGSPTSMERTDLVKYNATLSVRLGVAHSLWMMSVDNLTIYHVPNHINGTRENANESAYEIACHQRFNHDLPHPVPLNTAPTSLQMRVIGIAQAMQLPASTSPSASIDRLMIAIVPH